MAKIDRYIVQYDYEGKEAAISTKVEVLLEDGDDVPLELKKTLDLVEQTIASVQTIGDSKP